VVVGDLQAFAVRLRGLDAGLGQGHDGLVSEPRASLVLVTGTMPRRPRPAHAVDHSGRATSHAKLSARTIKAKLGPWSSVGAGVLRLPPAVYPRDCEIVPVSARPRRVNVPLGRVTDVTGTNVKNFAHKVSFTLAAAALVNSVSFAGDPADPFDVPIKQVAVDYNPFPQFEDVDVRGEVRCYYYPHLMIKEYDQGGSGAALSILHSRGNVLECKSTHQRGERVIDGSEWSGYLKGVKDTLVFFDPPDDFNGDSAFAVYDSVSGKQVFVDSAYGELTPEGYRTGRLQLIATEHGYLLKYLHVAYADCDLHAEGSACWEETKAKLDLPSGDMPVCTGYDHIAELVGTDHVPSEISYPVEVSLVPRPTIKAVGGVVECWPQQ
jgi:hypothetical protein